MAQPGAGTEKLRIAATDKVNNTFGAIGDRLETSLASRGMERSGLYGAGMRDIEKGRASALAANEANFSQIEFDQENRLMDALMRFGFGGAGSSTVSTSPGNMLGGALSSGMETATLLFALNQLGVGGGGKDNWS